MNTNVDSNLPQRGRIHPLVAGAAVAVILASATGIAAMTGILPVSHAVSEPPPQAVTAAPQVASAPLAAPQSNTPQRTARAPPAEAQGYGNSQGYQAAPESAAARPVASDPYAGEVVAINTVQAPEPTTGLGAVGGAVAGGLIGNQIGGGRGRVLATIAGAVGGGVAGNGIEHAVRKQTTYQVQVRMQDGSYRNFTYQTQPAVQVGERVHVSGDSLTAS